MAECPTYTSDSEFWNGIGCQIESWRQQYSADVVESIGAIEAVENATAAIQQQTSATWVLLSEHQAALMQHQEQLMHYHKQGFQAVLAVGILICLHLLIIMLNRWNRKIL